MLCLLGTGACLFAFVFTQQLRGPSEYLLLNPPASVPAFETNLQLRPAKNERFVYPYSVIPGGVLSREELVNSISSDRVVANHYSRFAVDQAKIVKAEETQFRYVAYRLRNKVYWTKKALRIPKGETLITDGSECARTRCGNMVSAVPMEPVSEEEPAIETFDMPVLARLEAPELDALPESSLDLGEFPVLESYIPVQRPKILPYYYRPLFVVKPTDVVVPEPATLSLLAIGLVAFVTIRFARKK
jgi:hypothetical protein